MKQAIWSGIIGGKEYRIVADPDEISLGRRFGQVKIEQRRGNAALGEPIWDRSDFEKDAEQIILEVAFDFYTKSIGDEQQPKEQRGTDRD